MISIDILQRLLIENNNKRDWWLNREMHAAWNDDGKGNHIEAMPKVRYYEARMDLLRELILSCNLQKRQ